MVDKDKQREAKNIRGVCGGGGGGGEGILHFPPTPSYA